MFHAKPHAPLSNPRELVENARRRGIDPRPGLLRLLVRRYLAAAEHSPAEQRRFATLVPRLVDAADRSTAIWAANALAGHAELPYEVAVHLARGPIEVAEPVLRHSPVLDDVSLLILAETMSPAHAAAIASRREVSPDLAKGIAAAMHEALESLAAESAAQAAASAPPAREENVAPSIADERDAEPDVFDEPEYAPEAGDFVPEKPTYAAASGLTPGDDLAALLARELSPPIAMPAALLPEPAMPAAPVPADTTSEPPAPSQPPSLAALAPTNFLTAPSLARAAILDRLITLPPLPMAERIRPADAATIDRLEQAALRHQPAVFASELEQALAIAPETASAIVTDASGEALVVACRVLGVPFEVVSRILIFLNPAIGHSVAQVFALASLFEALPEASAQHLAAAWRTEAPRRHRVRSEDIPSMRSFGEPRRAVLTPSHVGAERRERR